MNNPATGELLGHVPEASPEQVAAGVEAAVAAVRIAGFYNAGQDCCAACRVYAHAKVYDRFVAALEQACDGALRVTPMAALPVQA